MCCILSSLDVGGSRGTDYGRHSGLGRPLAASDTEIIYGFLFYGSRIGSMTCGGGMCESVGILVLFTGGCLTQVVCGRNNIYLFNKFAQNL